VSKGPSLLVSGLSAGYGGIEAIHDVDLELHPSEMVAVLGRNGAGKTTTLSAIAGLRSAPRGRVHLGERELRGLPPVRVAAAGIAFVPEGHRVFRSLSVHENLRLGAFLRRRQAAAIRSDVLRVFDLFPPLQGRERQPAGQLSGGEQQMVALGQALMSAPRFLLLDEPTAGLAPVVIEGIYTALRRLRDEGIGVLIVEQSVERALNAAERAYVMEGGRIVLQGEAAALQNDPRVEGIVLGDAVAAAEG
jgi:branched-chain amino acid transport system ATP-binding protein